MMNAAVKSAAPLSARSRGKVAAILAAARRLFREHGYEITSMDTVALEANVSKATLYVHFPGKRELFAAVVQEECNRPAAALLQGVAVAGGDLRATLLRVGRAVLELLTSPDTIAPYRMVAAEAARSPELGRLFYESAVALLHEHLERLLAAEIRAGRLRTGPPRIVAAQFIGLVRGDLMMRAVLCVDDAASEREKQATVRMGVEAFCRAWAA
jgi:AcrR family transcriptional regulator